MKRFLSIVLTLLCLAAGRQAAASTLRYSPDTIALDIPAGSEQQAPIAVGVDNPKASLYYLTFVNAIAGGTLPQSWLSAAPGTAFLFGGGNGTSTLTVRVPTGTPSGIYTGTLQARAMGSHDTSLPGTGIRLTLTVPAQCSGVPEVTITSIDPKTLWPPNHSMTQVTATGTIAMPDGCSVEEVGYAVDDEYGVFSGIHTLKFTGVGSFTAVVPLEAMRRGQDKDGRHYTLTFFAKNQAGVGSAPAQTIVVPHDQSNK